MRTASLPKCANSLDGDSRQRCIRIHDKDILKTIYTYSNSRISYIVYVFKCFAEHRYSNAYKIQVRSS